MTACLFLTAAALASDSTNLMSMSLDELLDVRVENVYGASRFEQQISEAPASVSIITADEIKKFGYRNLGDALRSVRGVFVMSDRNYTFLGVRGFARGGDYNSRLLLLVDGHRMNDNIYDSALYGSDATLDVDLVERIEFIRGPSSTIYGSSAFFGVVNVVTKRGSQVGGAEVSAEAGSLETYKTRFTLGTNFSNGLEFLVSGTLYQSRGDEKLHYREFESLLSSGVVRNSDEEELANSFASIQYHKLKATAGFSVREKNVPTASFNTEFADGRQKTFDLRGYGDLSYEHSFADETRFLGRIYYDKIHYEADFPFVYTPPAVTIYREMGLGDWIGTEYLINRTFLEKHRVVTGVEARANVRQKQINYDEEPRFYYLRDSRQTWNVGAFIEDEYTVVPDVHLNAGLRYDYYDTYSGSFSPRFGIIYNYSTNTTFKLLYGRAFRAPNVYELYYNPATTDLKAETIDTYEFVYEQNLPWNVRFTSASYYYQIQDALVEALNARGPFYDNGPGAEAVGQEFELERRWPHAIARASYAIQWAGDFGSGLELVNSPRQLIKCNLSIPLYRDKLFTGIDLQYYGRTRTILGEDSGDFTLVNLTLFSHRITPNLEVSATVYNLFDTRYGYPGTADHRQDILEQDGRLFRTKLTYKF